MNPPFSTTIRIPIDGLSQCLCPLIDSIALSSRRRIPKPAISATRRPCIANRAPPTSRLFQRRGYYGQAAALDIATGNPIFTSPNEAVELNDLPITQIHERLRRAPHEQEDAYKKTAALVHHLIVERGEKPSLIHYNALISVNADAQLGSAAVVEELLAEMKEQKISADSILFHNVLQVLAIHPDYVLRSQILDEMKERWIPLKPYGYHFLILGLLRDHQFEMALRTLQTARDESVPIPAYVQDTIIYNLLNTSELDTALALLQSRIANQGVSDVSAYVWYYMLSTCASAFHYPGIKYVWQKRVQPSYLNPSDGICTAALNAAARNHDPVLATDVIRVLANRTARIEVHHYEALMEAYIGVGDVKSAMRMLCIMKKAKITPDGASTRELVLWLRDPENVEYLNKSWAILKRLKADGQAVPTAAANAVLEAFTATRRLQDAIEAYKGLHSICVDGADTETFNVLLKGCREDVSTTPREKKALAMFLAAEMRALGVEASELTYDRLIIICLGGAEFDDHWNQGREHSQIAKSKTLDLENHELDTSESENPESEDPDAQSKEKENERTREPTEQERQEDIEDAFRYYSEMKEVGGARGWKPRRGTYTMMVKACGGREPDRAWALIREMDSFGMTTIQIRDWMRHIGFGKEEEDWRWEVREVREGVGGGRREVEGGKKGGETGETRRDAVGNGKKKSEGKSVGGREKSKEKGKETGKKGGNATKPKVRVRARGVVRA